RDAIIQSWILMHCESDCGPCKAVRRRALDHSVAQPVQTLSGSRVAVIRQCKERYCSCVDVWFECRSKYDAVAGIPAALRACAVPEHLRPELNSTDDLFSRAAFQRLFQGDQRERCRNDPADG